MACLNLLNYLIQRKHQSFCNILSWGLNINQCLPKGDRIKQKRGFQYHGKNVLRILVFFNPHYTKKRPLYCFSPFYFLLVGSGLVMCRLIHLALHQVRSKLKKKLELHFHTVVMVDNFLHNNFFSFHLLLLSSNYFLLLSSIKYK